MQTTDLPQIMHIEKQIYPNPWPIKLMQDCMNEGYQCIKGNFKDQADEVVCYALMMIGYRESNLLNISVNPKFQRQSIATQLMEQLLLISRINHAQQIWLEVRESNQAAIKLYEKFNFIKVGLRKNYYKYTNSEGKNIAEHAILMSRPVQLPTADQ